MKPVVFINSHPIQYFAPMYKYMSMQGIDVKVWYCSDESLKEGLDKEFGTKIKWDVPLLEGYDFKFFQNQSWKPSHFNGFFGLINFGMIKELFKIPKSIIVVHGWHYFSLFLILILGKLKGHTICLRNDMPLSHEVYKKGIKQRIKYFGLRYVLFPRINYFLFIGSQNKLFYKSYNVSDSRLLSCPYAVDNKRFQEEKTKYKDLIPAIKSEFGIPSKDKIVLFTAKYIDKKRPVDLLKAFKKLNQRDCWLIMVGEGELRKKMEEVIKEYNINNVILTGFVNQSAISKFYAICDVFVMCSGLGENWGLSVNEAMNFNIPIIISELSGCSEDLVLEGVNGYIFKTGDIEDLTQKLHNVLKENKLTWKETSLNIINRYSYKTITDTIRNIL